MPHGWTKEYNHAERRLWQDPEQILSEIGLYSGDTLADIGCGDGYFSLPAANTVGERGFVYALDASDEAIESLITRAREAGLANIRAIVGDAEKTVLCPSCADFVLIANVMHDFDSPGRVLANIAKTLKPSGVLADLDWKKESRQQHGPPLDKRLSQDEAAAILKQAGFKVVRDTLSGPFHYLLLATVV